MILKIEQVIAGTFYMLGIGHIKSVLNIGFQIVPGDFVT